MVGRSGHRHRLAAAAAEVDASQLFRFNVIPPAAAEPAGPSRERARAVLTFVRHDIEPERR
jgi:hypothetical protein